MVFLRALRADPIDHRGLLVRKTRPRMMGVQPADASAANGRPTSDALANRASSKDAYDDLRRRDPVAWVKPRVKGQPWTAPACEQLQPKGVHDLFCIAVDDSRCPCHSEQGTKYEVDAAFCRSIARDGIYNPFRKPLDGALFSARREAPSDKGRSTDVVVDATAEDAGGYWPKATIPQSYGPPQYQIATEMN